MSPVLPVCFMMAYAVALFCFMLVLCSTRGLPCSGRSWGIMAGIGSELGIVRTLCRGRTGLCTILYARLYAAFMLFDYAKDTFLFRVSHF